MRQSVEFTQVAKVTLLILKRYMTQHVGASEAESILRDLISHSVSQLGEHPQQYPVCHELDMLGVSDYQQLTYKKYKIIFRNDVTNNRVLVMAFLRQRQSAQQLLIDYVLKHEP